MFRILTIDGGGVRGLIPAQIINRIETEILHDRIQKHLNLAVGTSTGGLLAIGISDHAALGGSGLVDLYRKNATRIFPKTGTGTSYFSPKYPADGLRQVLSEVFESGTMGDCSIPCVVTTFDLESRAPGFFSSYKSPLTSMVGAGLATSAGETFFPAYGHLIDGGNIANNPSNIGIAAAVGTFGQQLGDIKLLSLGTGSPRPTPLKLETSGELAWAPHLTDVTIDGVARVNHITSGQLLGDRYLRLDCTVQDSAGPMDNIDPANMEYLISCGDSLFEAYRAELEEFFR